MSGYASYWLVAIEHVTENGTYWEYKTFDSYDDALSCKKENLLNHAYIKEIEH